MTKSNEELKRCPWCNGKAYINNFKSQPCQMHGDREIMWRIQCKHKDAKWMDSSSLPECHVKPVVVASTREQAIERWNTRPTVTPTDNPAVKTIIGTLQNWVTYDAENWIKEGREATDATHITAPPTWPSHGQIKEWIKTLRGIACDGAKNCAIANDPDTVFMHRETAEGLMNKEMADGDAERCLSEMATVQCAGDAADFLDAWELTIKTALQSTRKPPVDTIAVPKEVLQEVREVLKDVCPMIYSTSPQLEAMMFDRIQAHLATLDAVLSEGE